MGGEQSGHVIMGDYATTGDGVLTAVHLAARIAETGHAARRARVGHDPAAAGARQRPRRRQGARRDRSDAARRGRDRDGRARRHRPGAAAPVRHRAARPRHGRGADPRGGLRGRPAPRRASSASRHSRFDRLTESWSDDHDRSIRSRATMRVTPSSTRSTYGLADEWDRPYSAHEKRVALQENRSTSRSWAASGRDDAGIAVVAGTIEFTFKDNVDWDSCRSTSTPDHRRAGPRKRHGVSPCRDARDVVVLRLMGEARWDAGDRLGSHRVRGGLRISPRHGRCASRTRPAGGIARGPARDGYSLVTWRDGCRTSGSISMRIWSSAGAGGAARRSPMENEFYDAGRIRADERCWSTGPGDAGRRGGVARRRTGRSYPAGVPRIRSPGRLSVGDVGAAGASRTRPRYDPQGARDGGAADLLEGRQYVHTYNRSQWSDDRGQPRDGLSAGRLRREFVRACSAGLRARRMDRQSFCKRRTRDAGRH